MTQEEKSLLLKDLCGRLAYDVKIGLTWWVMSEGTYINTTLEPDHIEQLLNDEDGDTEIKPYLRPMSSMTSEERKEYEHIAPGIEVENGVRIPNVNQIDWLNAHHFDYRGLIEKKLAIPVTKDNKPYEN